MSIILASLLILGILVLNEHWWRRTKLKNEFARKFVHITVGSFVAFFPFFMSNFDIKLIACVFMFAVLVSKYFNIFSAIHSVQRPTIGEFWFALTVLLLAILPVGSHIFTASLLVMALADGLAAVIGTRFGATNQYRLLGITKSVAGTLTFLIVSVIILVAYSYFTKGPTVTLWFIGVSLVATLLENISYKGIDNITVPLTVAGLLYLL